MSGGNERSEPQNSEPATSTGPGQANTLPGERANPDGPKARILMLEDEAWDAELAQRLLTGAGIGFTAVVVATRESFVEQLAAFQPDVILSDYHLPGFSGKSALKIVQEQCPHIPFVFWSGVLGDEAAVELMKQGAADYVLKDRPARLPEAIQRVLAEAAQRAQLAQLEDRLAEAQRLASLGQLSAAEQAVSLTRPLLAVARRQVAAADPQP